MHRIFQNKNKPYNVDHKKWQFHVKCTHWIHYFIVNWLNLFNLIDFKSYRNLKDQLYLELIWIFFIYRTTQFHLWTGQKDHLLSPHFQAIEFQLCIRLAFLRCTCLMCFGRFYSFHIYIVNFVDCFGSFGWVYPYEINLCRILSFLLLKVKFYTIRDLSLKWLRFLQRTCYECILEPKLP